MANQSFSSPCALLINPAQLQRELLKAQLEQQAKQNNTKSPLPKLLTKW